MIFDLHTVVSNFSINMRIILSDPFSDRFYSYVACVYTNCRRTNQNRRSIMDLKGSSFLCLRRFLFLSRFFLFDEKSDNDGCESSLSGTCPFPSSSGESVGCVSGSVIEIFSNVGWITEIFFKVGWVTKLFFNVDRSTEIFFPLNNFHSFKLIFYIIFAVQFCHAHSSHRDFLNIIPIR